MIDVNMKGFERTKDLFEKFKTYVGEHHEVNTGDLVKAGFYDVVVTLSHYNVTIEDIKTDPKYLDVILAEVFPEEMIIEYLTENESATISELETLMGVGYGEGLKNLLKNSRNIRYNAPTNSYVLNGEDTSDERLVTSSSIGTSEKTNLKGKAREAYDYLETHEGEILRTELLDKIGVSHSSGNATYFINKLESGGYISVDRTDINHKITFLGSSEKDHEELNLSPKKIDLIGNSKKVYDFLRIHGEEISKSDLKSELELGSSSVNYALKKLEEKNFIKIDRSDRHNHQIRLLTRLLTDPKSNVLAGDNRIDELSAEIEQLWRVVNDLQTNRAATLESVGNFESEMDKLTEELIETKILSGQYGADLQNTYQVLVNLRDNPNLIFQDTALETFGFRDTETEDKQRQNAELLASEIRALVQVQLAQKQFIDKK